MGARSGLEPPECRARRQLLLRSASAAALVYRQYRGPSRASHEQPDTLLSAATGAEGSSRVERRRPFDADGKLPDDKTCALVRDPQETRAIQRRAKIDW